MAEQTGLRNNALPYPIYGVPWGVVFPLLDADGDPIAPSSPDSEVSLNGNTFADCTNEAVEITGSGGPTSGVCYLLLTAAEMTADVVAAHCASTGAKTTNLVLYPRKLVTLLSGTVAANASDGTTLQLSSGAVAIDDYYNGCLLVGTLDSNVEARVILDYVGSTKVCTVSPAFVTTPDNNDTFVVYLPEGKQVTQSDAVGILGTAVSTPATAGILDVNLKNIANVAVSPSTAQLGVNVVQAGGVAASATLAPIANGTSDSGTVTTMVDAARTEADTDYWKGAAILFTSGNITGQVRLITGFNATTHTVTFAPAVTHAVTTQTYEILPAFDPLGVDTYAEPGQGNPPATTSVERKLAYLYKAWRNLLLETADEQALYNDAGSVKDQKRSMSDVDGTLSSGEMVTGA